MYVRLYARGNEIDNPISLSRRRRLVARLLLNSTCQIHKYTTRTIERGSAVASRAVRFQDTMYRARSPFAISIQQHAVDRALIAVDRKGKTTRGRHCFCIRISLYSNQHVYVTANRIYTVAYVDFIPIGLPHGHQLLRSSTTNAFYVRQISKKKKERAFSPTGRLPISTSGRIERLIFTTNLTAESPKYQVGLQNVGEQKSTTHHPPASHEAPQTQTTVEKFRRYVQPIRVNTFVPASST